jgi:oligosaccharide repeat unit polymerase
MTSLSVSFLDGSIYTLINSVILLLFSALCARLTRSLISPAFVFSFVWGVALFILSFTPLIGFYPITSNALLIFVFGAILFSMTSLVTHVICIKWRINENLNYNQALSLNFNQILIYFNILSIIIIPILISDVMSYGGSLAEISYNLRVASLQGEKVGSFATANYSVIAFFLSILFIYAINKKQLNVLWVVVSLAPFLISTLVLAGRSGLISLMLSWLFVYLLTGGKINLKAIVIFIALFLFVLVFGATLVNKVDVNNSNVFDSISILGVHILDYLFQGPILFSRYFDNQLSIKENWDTLNSVCHALSKVELCTPISNIHADVGKFGPDKLGNVYSIYFAIFPHYSYIGIAFFIIFYSIITTYFFDKAKYGNIFALVVSGFLFGAIVLSIFKDGFGSGFWLFIKFYLISIILVLFFTKKGKFMK